VLYGDFWPGNVLYRADKLLAVIDWEDAGRGDPLADLANARLEITAQWGAPAAAEFTRRYRAPVPCLDCAALPCWDLCAALRPAGRLAGWGLDAAARERFRKRHRAFVDWALALPR